MALYPPISLKAGGKASDAMRYVLLGAIATQMALYPSAFFRRDR